MFSGLKCNMLGINTSDLNHSATSCSAVIPLYLTNPIAPNGIAPTIQIQDNISFPK